MENVSHLFLFKGKLQTKSPSPLKVWSPPVTSHPMPFLQNWGARTKPANLLISLYSLCRTPWLLAFVHITKLPATMIINAEKILSL